MKKLTSGILNWQKVNTARTPVRQEISGGTYDYESAVKAINRNTKPKITHLTNFKKTTARDESILNTTDMYKNVQLENTKEDREVEIEARKTSPFKNLI